MNKLKIWNAIGIAVWATFALVACTGSSSDVAQPEEALPVQSFTNLYLGAVQITDSNGTPQDYGITPGALKIGSVTTTQ